MVRQRTLSQGPLNAIHKLTEAWLRRDPEGMSEHLTEDIIEMGPAFSKSLLGKKHFFREYQKYFAGSLRIISYQIIHPRLVPLSRRLVLVHFAYRMTTGKPSLVEKSKGKESMLVESVEGRWRVKFIHWHRDPD